MLTNMLLISYLLSALLISGSISGGFSSDVLNHDQSPKTYLNSPELILNCGKFQLSNQASEIVVVNNTPTNLTVMTVNNYYFSYSNSTFVELDDQCQYNKDCRNIPYSICLQGICSCKLNYFPSDGKCLGLIEEACEEDLDCGVNNSICESGYCACKTGFFSRDNSECHRVSNQLGDFCENNQDCDQIKYSSCFDNSCKCTSKYSQQGNLCLGFIDAECSSDQDCYIKESICQEETCQCPENFYSEGVTCFKYADSYQTQVDSAKGCELLLNGYYSNGKCYANPKPLTVSDELTAGKFFWANASNGVVPSGAIEGGWENYNEPLFICRANHQGDMIPGKLNPKHGVCYIPWGYKSHAKSEYQVLLGSGSKWVETSAGNIPSNAILGSETKNGGPVLFIGRLRHEGTLIPGKVHAYMKDCYFAYGDSEISSGRCEILVEQ